MSKEIDFDKVEHVSSERCTGGDDYVLASNFDALLVAYKETRRALEDELRAFWSANRREAKALADAAIAEARTELTQEAMQGRAE